MPDRLAQIQQRKARNWEGFVDGVWDEVWLQDDVDHLQRRLDAAEAALRAVVPFLPHPLYDSTLHRDLWRYWRKWRSTVEEEP